MANLLQRRCLFRIGARFEGRRKRFAFLFILAELTRGVRKVSWSLFFLSFRCFFFFTLWCVLMSAQARRERILKTLYSRAELFQTIYNELCRLFFFSGPPAVCARVWVCLFLAGLEYFWMINFASCLRYFIVKSGDRTFLKHVLHEFQLQVTLQSEKKYTYIFLENVENAVLCKNKLFYFSFRYFLEKARASSENIKLHMEPHLRKLKIFHIDSHVWNQNPGKNKKRSLKLRSCAGSIQNGSKLSEKER